MAKLISWHHHMPEFFASKESMAWPADPTCLLPQLELAFWHVTGSPAGHPVPGSQDICVGVQAQISIPAMLADLIDQFLLLLCGSMWLKNVAAKCAEPTAWVTFAGPGQFLSLAIHDEAAKLHFQSFRYRSTINLLKLKANITNATVIAKDWKQDNFDNLTQMCLHFAGHVRSQETKGQPSIFWQRMMLEFLKWNINAPKLSTWWMGKHISWCDLICIDHQVQWLCVLIQSGFQQLVKSKTALVSTMEKRHQVDKQQTATFTIYHHKLFLLQERPITIEQSKLLSIGCSHILWRTTIRQTLLSNVANDGCQRAFACKWDWFPQFLQLPVFCIWLSIHCPGFAKGP